MKRVTDVYSAEHPTLKRSLKKTVWHKDDLKHHKIFDKKIDTVKDPHLP